MHFNDRESIIALTPLWKGERLPDGRPKVEDKYLDALYGMTLEEVWKPIYVAVLRQCRLFTMTAENWLAVL